jgi:NTE family protein
MKNERKALVLGGGGITGIGWELGLLFGLAELGVDLPQADIVIGTSAGAVVGAQLTSGVPLQDLYDEQLKDADGEVADKLSTRALLRWVLASLLPEEDRQARARLGKLALAARTMPESERRTVFENLLHSHAWPERTLLITAVEAATGELEVFGRNSGVHLVDAVGASCAVPMVWPPVTIGDQRYIDGGVRSSTNVDLAKGYGRVVVLAPTSLALRRSGRISHQLATLGKHLHSAVVTPSGEAKAAIGALGKNMLNPAFRAASARAGRAQARTVRDAVAVAWGTPPA